jgi:hypothetical protein
LQFLQKQNNITPPLAHFLPSVHGFHSTALEEIRFTTDIWERKQSPHSNGPWHNSDLIPTWPTTRVITNLHNVPTMGEPPKDLVLHKATTNLLLNNILHSSMTSTRKMDTDTMITTITDTRRSMMADTRI